MKQQTRDFVILISPVTGEKRIAVRGIKKTPPIFFSTRTLMETFIDVVTAECYHGAFLLMNVFYTKI